MSYNIIERLYRGQRDMLDYLAGNGEISFQQLTDENFRKILVLSSASLFESMICDALLTFVKNRSQNHPPLVAFVQKKAISRQYHTYFAWESGNANAFFGLFGDALSEEMKVECRAEPLRAACRSFIELGALRNALVHQNFAVFPFEKTSKEVYESFEQAQVFVDFVIRKLS